MTVPGFGNDPWWIILIKAFGLFVLLMVMTLLNVWYERRLIARMQQRVGPNRAGPFGLLQTLADGLKLAFKEGVTPKSADKLVYNLAPVLVTAPAFLAFAVIPLGPEVSMFGHRTHLQLTDLPVGVLYILAVTSIGVYGVVLGGWSGGSSYSLLGGLRSTAQVISYEVAMGLSFVSVFLYAGSMSTSQIVAGQQSLWYVLPLLPSFVIYVIAMVGETNRLPFDLAEAEGELVGGFHTEYSSLRFAVFFLAEYINMVTVSALATTMFLGGWRAPWPISELSWANTGYLPIVWFIIKIALLIGFFIWLRGTLPRFRYDQFMQLGWKVLIPLSLVWIVLVTLVRGLRQFGSFDGRQLFLAVGVLFALVLIALVVFEIRARREEFDDELAGHVAKDMVAAEPLPGVIGTRPVVPREFDPFAGGYPVPPLPGQVPVGRVPERELVFAGGTAGPGAHAAAASRVGASTVGASPGAPNAAVAPPPELSTGDVFDDPARAAGAREDTGEARGHGPGRHGRYRDS